MQYRDKLLLVSVLLTMALVPILGLAALRFLFGPIAAPPASVRTLDDYLAWRPKTTPMFRLTVGDEEFIKIYGPTTGFLNSGPPGYVLDQSGKLVDWTSDSGDDDEFNQKWRRSYTSRSVNREQVREIIDRKTRAR